MNRAGVLVSRGAAGMGGRGRGRGRCPGSVLVCTCMSPIEYMCDCIFQYYSSVVKMFKVLMHKISSPSIMLKTTNKIGNGMCFLFA